MGDKWCNAKVSFAIAFAVVVAASTANAQVSSLEGYGARPPGVPAEYSVTPGGDYYHPSCVIEIANDEVVGSDGFVTRPDGSHRYLPPCIHTVYDRSGAMKVAHRSVSPSVTGWLVDTLSTNAGAVDLLSAVWNVPANPQLVDGQTVFFFPGLVPGAHSPDFILQPVLAWNGFYDRRWTVASWNCCVNGNRIYSPPVPVSAGDNIAGVIAGSACNTLTEVCSTWQVTTQVADGRSTILNTTSFGAVLDLSYGGALEVADLTSCGHLPASGSITFSNVSIRELGGGYVNPTWSPQTYSASPSCVTGVSGSGPTVGFSWCVPRTCGASCGTISDGCGLTLDCGTCCPAGKYDCCGDGVCRYPALCQKIGCD